MKAILGFLVALVCAGAFAGGIEAQQCVPVQECGDVDNSSSVTATDALRVLRRAVGQADSLTCNCEVGGEAPVVAQPVQTGQTTCTGTDGAAIECAGTGLDGELQAGASHSFVDNGDGTITDQSTGLMWEKHSNDESIHDAENTYTLAEAVAVKLATLNADGFGGHDDWRLPNRNELATLINFGAHAPAAYSQFNTTCDTGCTVEQCNCTGNTLYWTSTSSAQSPAYQWYTNFSLGDFAIQAKTEKARVRAVRVIP
jgi:hypothetical protein